eukprot:CAMPEP_0113947618 /NCGR_PEP_ID=MMETSP1339-20121228/65771_1 /TAXON_ID=94617 /ORGANISM="Fibrocapsa japonica" /LENGTH=71 /DNA_ID=CAMNT_0000954287 /DNA_START=40 /DNA_END=251 /DNA_ORIENTATION=+ /assembly_acc=CAM_ASM_000762
MSTKVLLGKGKPQEACQNFTDVCDQAVPCTRQQECSGFILEKSVAPPAPSDTEGNYVPLLTTDGNMIVRAA